MAQSQVISTYKNVLDIVKVTWVTSEKRKQKRKEYRSKKLSLTNGNPEYNTHHIIPLGLGGTNHPYNLCIMKKEEHQYLHNKIINPQLKNHQVGDTFIIILPHVSQKFFSLESEQFKEFLKIYNMAQGKKSNIYKIINELKQNGR